MSKIIISVLGQDRPGIIAAVSRVLLEHESNIENVSQTTLQSCFAGIFIAAIPDRLAPSTIEDALAERLSSMGLQVHVQPMAALEAPSSAPEADPFVITTRGPDRKGLVAEISAVLAHHGVNITNLQALFKGGDDPTANIMIYEVDIPRRADHDALFADLKSRSEKLRLKISIQHREIFKVLNRI
ncbi:MAG: glycine cleavage system protein R [Desulfobacterales bacterium]